MDRTIFRLATMWIALLGAALPARALDDIPEGSVTWLQGIVTNVDSAGFQNAGTLRLESIDDSFDVALTITNGIFTNLAGGSVILNPGAGGQRGFFGSVTNLGSFTVNAAANFSRNFAVLDQNGDFSLAPEKTAHFFGVGQVFRQNAGRLLLQGALACSSTFFHYNGGIIQGVPALYNSALLFSTNATNQATFTLNGPGCQLLTGIPSGQTVLVLGNNTAGAAIANSPSGFENGGSLRLVAINQSWPAIVSLQTGILTNSSSGTISSEAGAGGPRTINGPVLNQGTLDIQYDLTVNPGSHAFIDEGRLNVVPGAALHVQGNYRQAESATARLQLDFPDPDFPVLPLVTSTNAHLAGGIEISLSRNFTPVKTNEFVLLQCTSRFGVFKRALLPPLTNGLAWIFNYRSNSVALGLTEPDAPPRFEFRLLSTNQFSLTFTAPVVGGYVLQASTNLTNWVSLETNHPFSGAIELVETNLNEYPVHFYRILPIE